MSHKVDWIDGWEIHGRPDGGYGVYDSHGLVAGPYGTKAAAMEAALQLPKHAPGRAPGLGQRLAHEPSPKRGSAS